MDVGPILAIDTSTATASVAIYSQRVLAELTWHSGRSHSREVLPNVDAVLQAARIDRADLAAIAVAVGPGSYSGLRVGLMTALGLAFALELGIVQVGTLEVLAYGQGRGERSVRSAVEVGRGRYASVGFGWSGASLGVRGEAVIVQLSALVGLAIAEGALLVVDLDPPARSLAEQEGGARLRLAPPGASLRRAGFLAELAALRLARGEISRAAAVEPIYLG